MGEFASDSEDSDAEGGLGNVSRVIIRPPGVSGKAKRGHLCFDAAYETGNLGRADLVGEFEYDLFLRPDTCNPRYRFWFNFTVDNVKQDQRVIFNVVNISKAKNLFRDGLTPLVKSSLRNKWARIPRENVFYYRSAAHQGHYVLSFAFAFDKEDEIYQFALGYPYSYSKLQTYLQVLEQKYPGNFERFSLGNSIQNRRLELITIDNVKKPEKVDPKNLVRVIVIIARVHPGESPASFVVQGLLEFLAANNHPISKILRENIVFKIIPMINPDGVFLGNNRCNVVGHDLNRSWNHISPFLHPTLQATYKMLRELSQSECYQIDFVIDIHAHNSLTGAFIYGNTYDDVYRYERHLVFPRLLAAKCHDFAPENMIFNADDRKSGTARRFFCENLPDTVNSYTFNVSMSGYHIKNTKIFTQYTEDGYIRLGRNLARAFLEYYRFTNVLQIPTLKELMANRKRSKKDRNRGYRRKQEEYHPRPRTTRSSAPINYFDLGIDYYASDSSDDGSPVRYPFHNSLNRPKPLATMQTITDQFSLVHIKNSAFNQLDFSSGQHKMKNIPQVAPKVLFEEPRKPQLSIIDVNQLTRGSLEEATSKVQAIGKEIKIKSRF
ncbi:cytosolic carboxypeptidase 6 [Culicoides brevitarsis]|uniref:cytosolic carboxypeptidase 6 n=1 Tax=Culicoides brevitarsis TaxID=469753 RepID=UPI00307B3497